MSAPPLVIRPVARSAALIALVVAWASTLGHHPLQAQSIDDPARLTGVDPVDVRAEASWDEAITMEAGGATPAQFLEALQATFGEAIAAADAAPSVVEGAGTTIACHVDTFYDRGLIVYSLRVQTEAESDDGRPVITWIKSDVGSYTVQQLHLMFRLGEQCADLFLDDWRGAN